MGFCTLALAATGAAVLRAQADRDPTAATRVYPPTDRALSRGMRRAEESIAAGEYSQALSFLDEILGRPEDVFAEGAAPGEFSGLKQKARQLIRDLPAPGRRSYESTYGPVAERLLNTAAAAGSAIQLEEVVQRYFHTPAGSQAALLLAVLEQDAGRHFAAALLYERLLATPEAARQYEPELSVRAAASWLAAGDAAKAEQLLRDLAGRSTESVDVAGRTYAVNNIREPLAWLREVVGAPAVAPGADAADQWLTHRGNVARNGATSGGLPHMRVRWQVRLMNHPKLEELLNEYSADLEQSGQITPVASAPLAAGNYILVRTPHGLLAVDFRTGKRIWRSELQRDPQLEQLVKSGGAPEDAAAAAPPARSFVRRVWKDYLYGLISSDGDRVFMIRDLPLPEDQEYELSTGGMGMELVAASNRLTAYDLTREGKLAWEIDGAAEDGPLGGAFFLGAPLAVGPSLYALVEIRGDISLAALDRTTGAVQWRQQLANLDSGVMMDMRRRLQSLAPSYDGGILVCPTGAGLVVGVDLSQRSLAWAYQFATLPQAGQMPRSARVRGDAAVTPGQWMDGAATIADGRVLLTPPESDELHCLDLQTGRLLWQRPRGEMQQLASVQQGRILLVGPGRMASMKLADGSFAWDAPLVLPQGASVTGAGFVSDGCYFAPLSTGEVVQVDLATGAIVGRVQNRGGAPLGNLICHRGTVISHDGRFLDCYDQVDALRERSAAVLAANPEGPDALRALGEIAYNEGRLSEALELLERGYRLAPDDLATREMLAECLGAALDEDFAAYRSRLPLLRQLQAEGAIALLDAMRLEAQGLTTVGDFDGALAACLKIYREAPPLDERYAFRSGHRTFISHWVQAQLLTIRDAAPAEMQRVLDDLVRAEATRLGDQPTLEPLQRFIAYFGALQAAEPQKLTYGHALGVRGQILESQQCLLDLASSKDRAIRREAVAAIAAQLHQPPRPTPGLSTLAREFDALLATEFANEPCLQGATGRELTSRWAESDAQAGAPATIAWPRGRVEVRPLAAPATAAIREGGPRGRSPVWNVRLDQTDSMLGGGTGFLSMRGGNLAWQDGYGRQFFTTPLEARSQAMYRQSGSLYASSRGNLLVVSLGRELVAFNTLANQDGGALLWRAALGNNFEAEDVYLEEVSGRAERRPGSYRAPRAKFQNKWTGVIGPVTSGGCVYQEGRRLSCVSPVTGEEIWSRRDVEEGSDLFGDERRLFATPKGGTVAQVFSMLDGRRLAEVELPPWRHQLATRGGAVLRWKAAEQGMELAALDALTGTIDWRHAFAAGARVDIDQNRTIAVVEPAGRCVLIDGADGKVLLEQRLPGHSRLEAVHLSVGVESYVLVIEHPPSGNTDRTVRAFNAEDSPVVDGQVVAFDRRSGAMLWQRPATVQRQALVQGMPPDLPFIAFAGSLDSRGGAAREGITALLLDKATGRTLYADDSLPQSGVGYCVATLNDAAQKQVLLDVAGKVMTVTYTAERRPPEPPAMAEVESPPTGASGGILGIFRTMGGAP